MKLSIGSTKMRKKRSEGKKCMPSNVTAGPAMLAMVCCRRHNCDQRTVGCKDVWRFPVFRPR